MPQLYQPQVFGEAAVFILRNTKERVTDKNMNQVDLSLYLITDSEGLEERDFLSRVEKALAAGVTLLQLREKERDSRSLYELAKKVNELAVSYGVPLIIDDRVDIALAVDAAGVHVGKRDLPVSEARRLMGAGKIVGATAKTVEQAIDATVQGADYLGVGAIYPTTTKVITVLTPVKTLADICRTVEIPAVAIGGLNAGNLKVLKGAGMAGIAVVSAIMKADNVSATVKELLGASAEMCKEGAL